MGAKNIWVTIAVIVVILLLIGGGIYLFVGVGKEELIKVTAYSCDEATRECSVTRGTAQAVIGNYEKVTHFSMEVTATPTGAKDITNLRVLSDTDSPATDVSPDPIGSSGTDAFYQALKNKQATPTQSGARGTSTTPVVWNTANTCSADADCDSGAGEKCYDIDSTTTVDKKCIIPASEYVSTSSIDYTFMASIEGTYTQTQGGTSTVTNSGSKIITFAPDVSAPDLFSISVNELPLKV